VAACQATDEADHVTRVELNGLAAWRSIHELWRTQPGLLAGALTDEQDL